MNAWEKMLPTQGTMTTFYELISHATRDHTSNQGLCAGPTAVLGKPEGMQPSPGLPRASARPVTQLRHRCSISLIFPGSRFTSDSRTDQSCSASYSRPWPIVAPAGSVVWHVHVARLRRLIGSDTLGSQGCRLAKGHTFDAVRSRHLSSAWATRLFPADTPGSRCSAWILSFRLQRCRGLCELEAGSFCWSTLTCVSGLRKRCYAPQRILERRTLYWHWRLPCCGAG